MAFRITPSLGPEVDTVYNPGYWMRPSTDSNLTGAAKPSYQLGSKVVGSDGHDYIFVQASGNISAASGNGTQVAITMPGGTAAAGSGGWYAPPDVAVPSGGYFHARKGALGTV